MHKINAALSTEEHRLPNGLTVFLTENPKAPNVVVSHWVKAGSLHETPGITGIAHLFEHMMFRPLRPGAPSFFEIATKLGGYFNANTRFESTYYYTSVPPKNLNTLLAREADRFQNLTVTKALLDIERKAVWSEYSVKFDSNPAVDLWFQIYRQAFPGHPFGWMITGEREDLEKIKAEDCNQFYAKYYRPGNVGLFVTGNFKAKPALAQIQKLYGKWKAGPPSALPPEYQAQTKEVVAEGKLASEGKFVLFGFRTPYFTPQNAGLQQLANYILFDAENGLLKKRLVDDKKLAAEVSEFNFSYDNGMQKAGIVALPSTSLDTLRGEVAKVASDFADLKPAQFESYKRNLFIRMNEDAQRNSKLADQVALAWGKYGDLDLASAFAGGPISATKEEVQQFLTRYYTASNFVFMTHKGQGK